MIWARDCLMAALSLCVIFGAAIGFAWALAHLLT